MSHCQCCRRSDKPLGHGTFGVVYKDKDKNGNKCAVKILNSNHDRMKAWKEVRILEMMNGTPHIIPLRYVIDDRKSKEVRKLVFKYIKANKHRKLYLTLSPEDVKLYMKQLLTALSKCHDKNIMHCDVKPGNILIDHSKKSLYLIDFGHADFYKKGKHYTIHIGTVPYKPPEILLSKNNYNTKVDIWAAGRVFFDMLLPQCYRYLRTSKHHKMITKLAALLGPQEFEQFCIKYKLGKSRMKFSQTKKFENLAEGLWKIARDAGAEARKHFESHCTPEAIDLLQQMLQVDPEKRISAEKALHHPYFKGTISLPHSTTSSSSSSSSSSTSSISV